MKIYRTVSEAWNDNDIPEACLCTKLVQIGVGGSAAFVGGAYGAILLNMHANLSNDDSYSENVHSFFAISAVAVGLLAAGLSEALRILAYKTTRAAFTAMGLQGVIIYIN